MGNAELKTINIHDCHFENDASFEKILEGCFRANKLRVRCNSTSECRAVAACLRYPVYVLTELHMKLSRGFGGGRSLDAEQAIRDISTSLIQNTTLKDLCIQTVRLDHRNMFNSDKLLCDVTSIEGISNSNHTLEYLSLPGHCLSTLAAMCLMLNRNENKSKVIRDK
jgi:hypothetical protein